MADSSIEVDPINRVLAALGEYQNAGENRWKARCPAHDDRNPSLSVALGDDGNTVLMKCHAGCSTKEVLASLGLELRDLFRPQANGNGHQGKHDARPKGKTYPSVQDAIANVGRGISIDSAGAMLAGSWEYHNSAGKVAFVVARWNLPDGGKEFRPIHPTEDGWRIGDPAGKLPLFGLPRLLAADRSVPVYVVEGEGKATLLRSFGLLVTTSAHGSKSATKTNWTPLAGRTVIILPDADQAGEAYAAQVAAILQGLTPAANVKIVRLPGLEPGSGDDVKEFAERRREDGKDDAEIRCDVEDLARDAPDTPRPTQSAPAPPRTPDAVPRTIVEVIHAYFETKYNPLFKVGAAIWSQTLKRDISGAEACKASTSDLFPALQEAADFPRVDGNPKRSMTPTIYKQYAPFAWADLLASMPEQAESPEISEDAGGKFRNIVKGILLRPRTFAVEDKPEARPLVHWCRMWAKPGKWKSIRDLCIWCRLDPDGKLSIAINVELFGQLDRRDLAPYEQKHFAGLCERYDIARGRGSGGKVRFVIFTSAFLDELFSRPDDATLDDDDDAGSICAQASSSSSSSTVASSDDEDVNGEAS